ncbi:DEAD/DEAH box helicase [Paraliomyxa miuraensis]|uniref:DEAD/DEAH box helicase n=1 Tax=Paraliomyxa miuraensis TaxID=376150 RepID=UPI002253929C|nr:DEAD/DEAH box helicase [Paraliomyxa miuraensis]MCX4243993.1 DEAD/DEAH box helicase [Paraliomyxa miuraensis]
MAGALELSITPRGHLRAVPVDGGPAAPAALRRAFEQGLGDGLLHLAGPMLRASLAPSLAFGQEIGRAYYEALCRTGTLADHEPSPPEGAFDRLLLRIPPMLGAEYAGRATLTDAWQQIHEAGLAALQRHGGELSEWLEAQNPAWHGIGRVYFHLAENKRDQAHPFAFVATWVDGLDASGRPLHRTLEHALDTFADDRDTLLRLLRPLELAAAASPLVARMVASGDVYRAVRWTPEEAFDFLCQVPACESAGVVVRVPDWWRSGGRRVRVAATVGRRSPSEVGFDGLLDFDVALALEGDPLSARDRRALLKGTAGLRLVRGQWVAVDPERLRQALDQLAAIEQAARAGELSFAEGMRLLAGLHSTEADATDDAQLEPTMPWHEVVAGKWLAEVLAELGRPAARRDPGPRLRGELRGYQREGVAWTRLLCRLGLGGCLADDMGLGKTIQILASILVLDDEGMRGPHLIVVPASLLGNWQAEAARFAPDLSVLVAHRSQTGSASVTALGDQASRADLVLTTYGTLTRTKWLRERPWGIVVLDEGQAIKNPATQQARAVKQLRGRARLVLTGTPIENRIEDLWSLMDFTCPGLLGSREEFRQAVRAMERSEGEGFSPLRRLVAPYILRRLKSDPSIVPDLPDKTEMIAYCGLSKKQAALYQDAVDTLADELESVDGIRRRGLILAYLQRFKQICNHPSHWLGDGRWSAADSGKFLRLAELCEALATRQERVLVFTQFRELTGPLQQFLEGVFGRPGLRLDGRTPVRRRAELVEQFQDDDGPPFFVVSLKAGGTGLNLTAASHVVHFDRWWNPAVENQATDRAYRIGQRRNVLVQKLVCRGTLEERIDAMITSKQALADEVLSVDGAAALTEMSTEELMATVRLDLGSAIHGA